MTMRVTPPDLEQESLETLETYAEEYAALTTLKNLEDVHGLIRLWLGSERLRRRGTDW